MWDDLHRLFPISLGILFVFGVILCSGIILEHELAGQPTSPGMSILSDGSASLESSLSTSASAPASTTAASTSSPSPSTTETGSSGSETTSASASSAVVPSSAPVPDGSFKDALFIGDSRTQGLMLYAPPPGATFYAVKGLTVSKALDDPVVEQDGQMVTIPQALKAQAFRKVYIMLGLNELGWVYPSIYVARYGELIDAIRAACPEAVVYIEAILPVTQKRSDSDATFNNPRIAMYNALLLELAEEKQAHYLAVGDAVGLDHGALPAEAASDGIHLNSAYCAKWREYLKTHTAI